MEFLKLAKERYSLRNFSHKKVEKEKLDIILEAGRVAPTAVNYQPQRILVLDNDESLEKLKLCTKYHFNAPLAILICYDSNVSWKRTCDQEDEGVIDASIVATHMMLQVHELGLGSTWVGNFDVDLMKKEFNIPENIVPAILFPMGYPNEEAKPASNHYKRYNIEETVFYNNFDNLNSKHK